MGEEPQEPSKQFPLRSLFMWTLLVALFIALMQRLGGVGTIALMITAGFLLTLTGLWVILIAGILLFSITANPSDEQRMQVAKCWHLALIGLLMCVPAAVFILIVAFPRFL